MHRPDNTKFLLFIEPKKEQKSEHPIQDDMTILMELALQRATPGTSNYSEAGAEPRFNSANGNSYKGIHYSADGARSDNKDYLLENGMVTNSLAPHYLRWFRNAIPETELKKLQQLYDFYNSHDGGK